MSARALIRTALPESAQVRGISHGALAEERTRAENASEHGLPARGGRQSLREGSIRSRREPPRRVRPLLEAELDPIRVPGARPCLGGQEIAGHSTPFPLRARRSDREFSPPLRRDQDEAIVILPRSPDRECQRCAAARRVRASRAGRGTRHSRRGRLRPALAPRRAGRSDQNTRTTPPSTRYRL